MPRLGFARILGLEDALRRMSGDAEARHAAVVRARLTRRVRAAPVGSVQLGIQQ
jgi:hypothetical protein